MVTLYRYDDRDLFDDDDLGFMRGRGAPGARSPPRAADRRGERPRGTGRARVDRARRGLKCRVCKPDALRWLRELPDGNLDAGDLPSAVYAVAGRALRTANGADAPGEVAVSRVLSRTGRWMVLHGASMVADGQRRAAIIIEPAQGSRISPLLMAAYGLTDREQEITG